MRPSISCAALPFRFPPPLSQRFPALEEEIALGYIFAQSLDAHLAAIDDDALTGHLRAIGDRLSAHGPVSGLHFRFYLSDAPQANAFPIAGGRILELRKVTASFLRSEDELAAVIGHEMGHIVTHQSAIINTALLQQLQVSHIDDINQGFDKVNLIMESKMELKRNPGLPEKASWPRTKLGLKQWRALAMILSRGSIFRPAGRKTKARPAPCVSELMSPMPPISKWLRGQSAANFW